MADEMVIDWHRRYFIRKNRAKLIYGSAFIAVFKRLNQKPEVVDDGCLAGIVGRLCYSDWPKKVESEVLPIVNGEKEMR